MPQASAHARFRPARSPSTCSAAQRQPREPVDPGFRTATGARLRQLRDGPQPASAWQTLRALPEQLRNGYRSAHRFIYVWGPPGSGKSHLAEALRARNSRRWSWSMIASSLRRGPGAALPSIQHHHPDPGAGAGHLRRPAAGAPAVMPELASRLGWGIVFALEPLAATTTSSPPWKRPRRSGACRSATRCRPISCAIPAVTWPR